jgi:chitin synthase
MSNMNFFGGGPGSVSGSGFGGGMPMQQPPQLQQMNTQSRFSVMSMGTALNPFAAGPSQNPDPDDEELLNVLRAYLSSQDLMTVTKKSVVSLFQQSKLINILRTAREAVMAHFPNANLAPKREFLNTSIDNILASG